jgi:uncharacterized repeat protein (TIGR04042 family)
MPEMRFRTRWPDGRLETCHSPSLVIQDYLVGGESDTLADFPDRGRARALDRERTGARERWQAGSARAEQARPFGDDGPRPMTAEPLP